MVSTWNKAPTNLGLAAPLDVGRPRVGHVAQYLRLRDPEVDTLPYVIQIEVPLGERSYPVLVGPAALGELSSLVPDDVRRSRSLRKKILESPLRSICLLYALFAQR